MKKLILTTLIAAGLGITAQGAFAVNGVAGVANLESGATVTDTNADGIVQIQGLVVDTTCTITGNAGQHVNLDLPKVQASKLAQQGAKLGEKSFEIKLSDCQNLGDITKARAYFLDNTSYVNDNGRLINQLSSGDAATKVSIELLNSDDSVINPKLRESQSSNSFNIVDNAAILKYKARYYAEAANVTAGKVLAKVEYYIEYQ
ncbi:fimbrial protein [Gallibacterium sp. AGMB14963]|uniref:fimbrial protein n=1 Tax=Gallibacterium faecale TaxID=3019086 RepID=UPI0022F1AB08|nr:fimbrial protein [Gallibacterium sp. AGMB14963]MDA3978878.1 fimbrial protein [Gallibacterium sp. AGMB14963]